MRSSQAFSAIVSAAFALSVAPASLANVNPPPPPTTPSIGQYVETVPTAGGGSPSGVGRRHSKALPPGVIERLTSVPDQLAKRLTAIATSSAYGAPQQGLAHASLDRDSKTANPFSAAVTAVSGSGDSHFFWLLAAVLLTTAGMIWSVRRRA